MKILNRFGLPILFIMMFVLPFWVSIGRSLVFNVAGYYLIIYLIVAIVLFVFMLQSYRSFKKRPDVVQTKSLAKRDTIALLGLYLSVLLHGIFWLDQADGSEQASGATVLLHMSVGVSLAFAVITFIASLFFLALSFVLATQRSNNVSARREP